MVPNRSVSHLYLPKRLTPSPGLESAGTALDLTQPRWRGGRAVARKNARLPIKRLTVPHFAVLLLRVDGIGMTRFGIAVRSRRWTMLILVDTLIFSGSDYLLRTKAREWQLHPLFLRTSEHTFAASP